MSATPNSSIFVFLVLLLQLSPTASEPQTHLSAGSHLSVERATQDYLLSPDGTFTFGFYGGGNVSSNAFWLAIWFTNSAVPNGVVWVANRDKPVNGRGSRLNLNADGALILTDVDGTVAWRSNTTSTAAAKAQLFDTGNLIVKTSTGKTLWQSFDQPTDTLLPGQPLTKSKILISSLANGNFGSGYFNFLFDNNNVLILMYNGPQITSLYWPDPDINNIFELGRTVYNSSRIAVLDDLGGFLSSDRFNFSASDHGTPKIKRMLKIDYDGNLRLYSFNEPSSAFTVTWQALGRPCLAHGVCGPAGICVYRPNHECSCPPGYEPTRVDDWSKGCKPMFKRSCFDSVFMEMKNTDYYGFDLAYSSMTDNFEDCKKLCSADCACLAFNYRKTGEGKCFTKSALFNGYNSPDSIGDTYIRLPREFKSEDFSLNSTCKVELPLPASFSDKGRNFIWVYLYSFASAVGAVEVLVLVTGWFLLFRRNGIPTSLEEGYRSISRQFRRFDYGELKTATNQFKTTIGEGGFGVVYKGSLEDGRIIAVKRLGDLLAEEEFWAEVSTIGKINHMNLVQMWGFCSEKKHRLLVYEFVENGSLDKHLFGGIRVLGWKERFKVAKGMARGLAYLHHECLEWIIHCDVKPENILLDSEFDPKISDFGLAKLSQRGGPAGSTTTNSKARGTKGYMAPEWAVGLPVTAKVDVYSYGVVVLELVRGVRLSEMVDGSSEFGRLVKERMQVVENEDPNWVEDFVDRRLEGEFGRRQAAGMIRIGLACVDEDRNKRPTMESVAQYLLECDDVEV